MRQQGLDEISKLILKHDDTFFIGSDIGSNTLQNLKSVKPHQFLMEGISESNLLGMSAGLASTNKVVFVNTISTFLTRRALDQLIINICYDMQSVILYGNGGGLTYGPLGYTHTAIDDLAITQAIPNLQIYCPADELEMRACIRHAHASRKPCYIRVGKGNEAIVTNELKDELEKPKFISKEKISKSIIITTGTMLHTAIKIHNEKPSIDILHFPFITSISERYYNHFISKYENLIFIDNHLEQGSFGQSFSNKILKNSGHHNKSFFFFNLGNSFPSQYITSEKLEETMGISAEFIIKHIHEKI